MPVCHRCERVLPTGELRRTTLGFLCKENQRFSRCWQITRELAAERRAARRREAVQSTERAEISVA